MRSGIGFRIIGRFLLFLIIPILLIVRLGWDAILPMIVYMQFLLIWSQVEISMRQNVLFSAQFEPLFSISINGETIETATPARKTFFYNVNIKNISNNPAYNLGVGRLLDKQYRPIPPEKWFDPNKIITPLIPCLPPSQEVRICRLDKELYENIRENDMILAIFYHNRFGEFRELFVRFSRRGAPLLVHERIQRPGILLRIFEDLAFFFRYRELQSCLKTKANNAAQS